MSNFSKGFGSLVSRVTGVVARLETPRFFVQLAQKIFIKKYGLNMSECIIPHGGSFDSLHKLFIRDLKPGVRVIGDEPVSPADGTLRDVQGSTGRLVQVKGIEYTIETLTAGRAREGTVVNMYLSPKDYHHVHSPVTGILKEIAFIPGALWPVNNWALSNVTQLFSTNERAVFTIETEQTGTVYMVMVGALNVGNIITPWGESPATIEGKESLLFPQVKIKAGERVGTFALGSSVLVVFPPQHFKVSSEVVGPVWLGESLDKRGVTRCPLS